MKRRYILCALWVQILALSSFCQGNPPWNNPLNIARSTDGVVFSPPTVFQDSSGVPSVIKWKGDTLIAAFQWFRQPNPSPSWDRVATKFSYDNGLTWTQPIPIVVNGLPTKYQRPFDPTLAVFGKDSIRIYFSSSDGLPVGGLNATVNTYSAKSADGLNFYFEPGPRVDEPANRVIDPAIVYFNTAWHYLSPIGSPQQGAYHYVSPDGLNFTAVPNIPSDNSHNWTGNYTIESNTELRFYGSGKNIWYNKSPNGGTWSGFVQTNVQGGDPSVVKISNKNYLMVYVGQPYTTSTKDHPFDLPSIHLFPNPVQNTLHVKVDAPLEGTTYLICDSAGKCLLSGRISTENTSIDMHNLPAGIYLFTLGDNWQQTYKIMKK